MKTQRYRFASDDDGHNYLIKDEDVHRFEEWLEAGPYWEDYEGQDFSEDRIDSPNVWTFTDPKLDV